MDLYISLFLRQILNKIAPILIAIIMVFFLIWFLEQLNNCHSQFQPTSQELTIQDAYRSLNRIADECNRYNDNEERRMQYLRDAEVDRNRSLLQTIKLPPNQEW